jgi:hypothetical protein
MVNLVAADSVDVVRALTKGTTANGLTHGINEDLAWHLLRVLDAAGYMIVVKP